MPRPKKEAKAEYNRRWRERHPEERRKYARWYYENVTKRGLRSVKELTDDR